LIKDLDEETGRDQGIDAEGAARVNAQAKGPVLDKLRRVSNPPKKQSKENLSGKQTKALVF